MRNEHLECSRAILFANVFLVSFPLDFGILILANHLLNYILCGSFSSISCVVLLLLLLLFVFPLSAMHALCLFLSPAGLSSRLFVSSTLRPLRVFPPRPLRLPVADRRPLRLFRGRSRILKRRSHRIITHARFEPPSASSWYFCDPIQHPSPSLLLLPRPLRRYLVFSCSSCPLLTSLLATAAFIRSFLLYLSSSLSLFTFSIFYIRLLLSVLFFLDVPSCSCIGQLRVSLTSGGTSIESDADREITMLATRLPAPARDFDRISVTARSLVGSN